MADSLTWSIWPDYPWLSVLTWVVLAIILATIVRPAVLTVTRQLFRAIRHTLARIAHRLDGVVAVLAKRNHQVLMVLGRSYLEREIRRHTVQLKHAVDHDLAQIAPMGVEVQKLVEKMQDDYASTQEQTPELPEWLRASEAMAASQAAQSGNRTLQHLLQQLLDRIQHEARQVRQEYRQAIADRHTILSQFLPFWRRLLQMQGDIGQGVRRIEQRTERLEGLLEQFERLAGGEERSLRFAVGSVLVHFMVALVLAAGILALGLVGYWVIAPAVDVLIPVSTYTWGIVAVAALLGGQAITGMVLLENMQITRLFRAFWVVDTATSFKIRLVAFIGLCAWSVVNGLLAMVAMSSEPVAGSVAAAGVESNTGAMLVRVIIAAMTPWVLTLLVLPLEPLLNGIRVMLGTSLVWLATLLTWSVRLLHLVTRVIERMWIGAYEVLCSPLTRLMNISAMRKQTTNKPVSKKPKADSS